MRKVLAFQLIAMDAGMGADLHYQPPSVAERWNQHRSAGLSGGQFADPIAAPTAVLIPALIAGQQGAKQRLPQYCRSVLPPYSPDLVLQQAALHYFPQRRKTRQAARKLRHCQWLRGVAD